MQSRWAAVARKRDFDMEIFIATTRGFYEVAELLLLFYGSKNYAYTP